MKALIGIISSLLLVNTAQAVTTANCPETFELAYGHFSAVSEAKVIDFLGGYSPEDSDLYATRDLLQDIEDATDEPGLSPIGLTLKSRAGSVCRYEGKDLSSFDVHAWIRGTDADPRFKVKWYVKDEAETSRPMILHIGLADFSQSSLITYNNEWAVVRGQYTRCSYGECIPSLEATIGYAKKVSFKVDGKRQNVVSATPKSDSIICKLAEGCEAKDLLRGQSNEAVCWQNAKPYLIAEKIKDGRFFDGETTNLPNLWDDYEVSRIWVDSASATASRRINVLLKHLDTDRRGLGFSIPVCK